MIYESVLHEECEQRMWNTRDGGITWAPRVYEPSCSPDEDEDCPREPQPYYWSGNWCNLDAYTRLRLVCRQIEADAKLFWNNELNEPNDNIEYKMNVWVHDYDVQLSWARLPFNPGHCRNLSVTFFVSPHTHTGVANVDSTMLVNTEHLGTILTTLAPEIHYIRDFGTNKGPLNCLTSNLTRSNELEYQMWKLGADEWDRRLRWGLPEKFTIRADEAIRRSQDEQFRWDTSKRRFNLEKELCGTIGENEDARHEYFDFLVSRQDDRDILPRAMRFILPSSGWEWNRLELIQLHNEWKLPHMGDDPTLWGQEDGEEMETWGYEDWDSMHWQAC